MALVVTLSGHAMNSTSQTTLVFTPTTGLAVGSLGVLLIAFDNSGGTGNTKIFTQATFNDSAGNLWTRRLDAIYDPVGAAAGVEIAVYTAPIVTALTTSATVTITASTATLGKTASCYEVSSDAARAVNFVDAGAKSDGLTSGQTGTAVSITTSSIAINNLVIGFIGQEGSGAPTAFDSDTTNGSWSTGLRVSAPTPMQVAHQWKIVTATGTQTYDQTLASSQDWNAGWVQIAEAAGTLFTQTLTGTLSSSAALWKCVKDGGFTAALSFIGNLATSFIAGGGTLFTQTLTATLSFIGNLGALNRFVRALTATLSSSAALTKKLLDSGFTATLSPLGGVGALRKLLRDAGFAATLSFTGLLTASKSFLKAFTATLSFVGNLATSFIAGGGHLFTQSLTATTSFVGAIAKLPRKGLAATFAPVAALTRKIIDSGFTASLSFVGAQTKRIIDSGFTATLSFAGNLATAAVHIFTKSLTATLSFTGNLVPLKLLVRAFTATLSFAGTIWRKTGKVFAATKSFSVASKKAIRKTLGAILHLIGFVFRGGATTVLAGQITGGTPSIAVAGSTTNIIETGSAPRIGRTSSSIKIAVTGSRLQIIKTKSHEYHHHYQTA